MSERTTREAVVDYARRLHARGWVANHDGNVTARLTEGRFIATPTATSKAAVTTESLIVVDANGERIAGQGRPFGELGLHLTVYAGRPDVAAVVHAHPPAATGIACAGSRILEQPIIAEAVVSLGPAILTVPFAPPGRTACDALAPYVGRCDAVLLANHGVMAWGASVEQAYLRLELVEHLARVAREAERAGGLRPLPTTAIPALLEARRKAGLGLAAEAAPISAPNRVVACAPAPPGATVEVISPPTSDLATIIREELGRVLGKPR